MKYLRYFEQINHKPNHIDVIVDAYLETALWTSETEDNHEEFDDKTIWNFSDNAKKQTKEEIEWFLDNAGDVFDEVSNTTIGHDLWLSRNGYGSGFFDRDGYDEDDAKVLTDLAKILGEIYLEVNNDTIYFVGGSEKYKNFDLEKYLKEIELKKMVKKFNI